nr:fibronectin type III domain-containing protein [Kibdelosporangium phytohabitans]
MSTGDVVVLVERQSGNVLTYAPDGRSKETKPIKQKNGEPRLSQGEDNRVYVEDTDGTQVIVVARDGNVQDVSTADRPSPTPAPNTGGPGDVRVAAPPPSQPPKQPTREPDKPQAPPPVPPGRPGAPASVSATAGNNAAVVKWGSAVDNRADITSYQVSWRASTGQTGSLTTGGGARQTTVNGLSNGVSYVFTVTATNRMGTGPGASSAAVTLVAPVSPASAPINLRSSYDVNDRPTRDVTLLWNQPSLNGGTLVHYVVAGTGLAQRTVTGTQTAYAQLPSATKYTFTVRAVTRTPDGNTVTGQPATHVVQDTPPPAVKPQITISQGGPSSSDNCERPNCFWVITRLTGFPPGKYRLTLSSNANPTVNNSESVTVNADGKGAYDKLNYDVPNETVWVSVQGPDGRVQSNKIVWKKG